MTVLHDVCGSFLPTGRCQGRVLVSDELCSDRFIVGECESCGAEFAISTAKADPQVRRARLLERAGLPRRFVGVPFESDEHNKGALYQLRGFVADMAGFLAERRKWERLPGRERERKPAPKCPPAPALWGEQGRGKTHALVALCVRLIREADASVLWFSSRGLLRALQDFDGAARDAWQRALSVDVLALDDLGAQQQTDWRLDQLADLVDARYERDRPVLVATNFAPSMWPDMLDARTASRLRGMTFPVELRGRDRRQAALPVRDGVA